MDLKQFAVIQSITLGNMITDSMKEYARQRGIIDLDKVEALFRLPHKSVEHMRKEGKLNNGKTIRMIIDALKWELQEQEYYLQNVHGIRYDQIGPGHNGARRDKSIVILDQIEELDKTRETINRLSLCLPEAWYFDKLPDINLTLI